MTRLKAHVLKVNSLVRVESDWVIGSLVVVGHQEHKEDKLKETNLDMSLDIPGFTVQRHNHGALVTM